MDTPVVIVADFQAKPGAEAEAQMLLSSMLEPTRKEEGCLQYNLHAAADHPGSYLLHEVWASRDDHGAHTRTPHFLRWNARKDALISSRESAFYRQIA